MLYSFPDSSPATGHQGSRRERLPRTIALLFFSLTAIVCACAYVFMPVSREAALAKWNASAVNLLAPAANYYPQAIRISGDCQEFSRLPQGHIFTSVPATETSGAIEPDAQRAKENALVIYKTAISEIVVLSRGQKIFAVDTNSCKNFQIIITKDEYKDTIDNHSHSTPTSTSSHVLPVFLGFFRVASPAAKTLPTSKDLLNVTVTYDNSYQHLASGLKKTIGGLSLLCTVVCAGILWLLYRGSRQKKFLTALRKQRKLRLNNKITASFSAYRKILISADIIVISLLIIWHFIGANTADDGYILTMAQERSFAGYDPNFFRWFTAGESPFGWFYGIYQLLGSWSKATFILRLPELVFGISSWLLLAHTIYPIFRRHLGIASRLFLSYVALAGTFLVYWFTFNNGIRPEGIMSLGFAITLWLCLLTVRTKNFFAAYLAVIAAVFTIACGPTGLIVLGPLVWLGFNFYPTHRELTQLLAGKKHSTGIITQFIIYFSAAVSIIPIAFYYLTGPSFLTKAAMQRSVGPSLGWYEEYTRYNLLFSYSADGSMPRRIAVLATLLALTFLIVVAIHKFYANNYTNFHSRRTQERAAQGYIRLSAVIGLGASAFLLLILTPTKPTHHFGAFAIVGPLLVAIATSYNYGALFHSRKTQALWLSAGLFVMAIAYTGPNMYWYISSAHILWSNTPIRVGKALGTLLFVAAILVGLSATVLYFVRYRLAGYSAHDAETVPKKNSGIIATFSNLHWVTRSVTVFLPAMVIFTAAVEFLSFTYPAAKLVIHHDRAPYSIAKGNFKALQGDNSNLGGELYAEVPTHRGILLPADPSDLGNIGTHFREFSPTNIPYSLVHNIDLRTVTELSALTTPNTVLSDTTASITSHGTKPDSGRPQLPYGLPNSVRITGNYSSTTQTSQSTYLSGWYKLPALNTAKELAKHPLLVVTVAGKNQAIHAEFAANLNEQISTPMNFIDPFPGEKWRNIVIDLRTVSPDTRFVRLSIQSSNANEWTVISTPRVPDILPLAQLINNDPVLIDWAAGLGFPTLKPFAIKDGLQQPPRWRILPERSLIKTTSDWEDFRGAGPMGLIAGYSTITAWPVYPINELGSNYGAVEKLTPLIPAVPIALPDGKPR